jgi:hypothetical protein
LAPRFAGDDEIPHSFNVSSPDQRRRSTRRLIDTSAADTTPQQVAVCLHKGSAESAPGQGGPISSTPMKTSPIN